MLEGLFAYSKLQVQPLFLLHGTSQLDSSALLVSLPMAAEVMWNEFASGQGVPQERKTEELLCAAESQLPVCISYVEGPKYCLEIQD